MALGSCTGSDLIPFTVIYADTMATYLDGERKLPVKNMKSLIECEFPTESTFIIRGNKEHAPSVMSMNS